MKALRHLLEVFTDGLVFGLGLWASLGILWIIGINAIRLLPPQILEFAR